MPKKRPKKPPEKTAVFKNQPFRESLGNRAIDLRKPADLSPEPPPEPTPDPTPNPPEPMSDEAIFADAVADAAPLKREKSFVAPSVNTAPRMRVLSDEEQVMRRLDELVHGNVEFDLSDSDEYMEACITGFDHHTLKRLRAGEFSLQAHLDLHGFRVEEARLKVAAFIEKSTLSGMRCVLIVHGRGLRSPDRIPVLKENLRLWLTRGAIGRHVLAYTSARPSDGGTGAVYVLLRQRRSEKFR